MKVLFLPLFLTVLALLSSSQDPKREALTPEARAAQPRIVELLKIGIETKEPNTGMPGTTVLEETIFDGSYDYHSCVIAHWALCVVARTEKNEDLNAWLDARITNEVLKREQASLSELEELPWTFPYEHAWMAMLLSELAERDSLDQDLVRSFRLSVEQKLLQGLEAEDFPENLPPEESGGTVYNGFYKSWLMAFWLLQMSDPVTEGAQAQLDRWRREKLEPHREKIAAHDKIFGFDFLYVPALLALVDRTGPSGSKSPYDPTPFPDLPDELKSSRVHALGIELSRIWPCAWDAGTGDRAAREHLGMQLDRFLAREDLWADDFALVAHWVPQYLFIATWLADGRP